MRPISNMQPRLICCGRILDTFCQANICRYSSQYFADFLPSVHKKQISANIGRGCFADICRYLPYQLTNRDKEISVLKLNMIKVRSNVVVQ